MLRCTQLRNSLLCSRLVIYRYHTYKRAQIERPMWARGAAETNNVAIDQTWSVPLCRGLLIPFPKLRSRPTHRAPHRYTIKHTCNFKCFHSATTTSYLYNTVKYDQDQCCIPEIFSQLRFKCECNTAPSSPQQLNKIQIGTFMIWFDQGQSV